jgi:DNA replication protein DnaC
LNWIRDPKFFLVYTGPAGTGKTYFCAAVMNELYERFVTTRTTFRVYDEKRLFSLVRNHIGDQTSGGDFMIYAKQLVDDTFIILDDVGSSRINEWTQELLLEIIDYRTREKAPTLITTNLSQSEMKDLYGHRISSRIFAAKNTIIDSNGMKNFREEGL